MIYIAITKIGNTYYMYILKDEFIYLIRYPFCRVLLNKKLSKRIINKIVSNNDPTGQVGTTIINGVEEFIKYIDYLFWEKENIIEVYKL